MPPEDLKYAQVCKKVGNGYFVEVLQRVVFGDTNEVLKLLGQIREAVLTHHILNGSILLSKTL